MLLRETGELLIIEASPAGCRELSRVPMLSGSTWSPPALSEGRLYCRNRAGDAICVRVRATEAEWRMAQSKPGMAEQEPASARADAGFRTAMTPIRSSTAALLAGPSHMQWPRFRGPGGLGSVPHINGPISWNGKTGQGIAWKSSVPLQGPSSPVVWKERIFLTGANNQQREVYAYDAASGKTLWRKTVRSSADTENTLRKEETKSILAAPTPATDGEFVWAMFGTGDVACFDMSGLEKWTRSLGMPENSYGHSSSLELWDGMLIIQLDQGDGSKARSKLLALDSRSGNTRWECRRTSPACWSSPIVALWNGGAQLIVNGCPTVTAYNPKDGREIWRVRITGGEVVPSPVLASGLILAGSVDGKFAAIRLDGQGDVTQTHIAWSVEEGVPAICSPVSNGELVFLVDSSGIVVCYDLATGKKVWEHEFDAHFQASPTLAGDKLYVLADSGEMFILQAGRQYELLARAELGEGCVASPAFQPGRIYLRGQNNLYCAGGTGSR
jgi:outer membrane protein assembly factor BamB